ncbi:negative regulator GrlR [Enterobacter hormaechei subsp. steigerwaltii]|uniref:GrlR family regulatory protein n=1 Tax=Enterobacter hormaechei TaxID=158836 RepID=UPI000F8202DD|nr:GrlR family regulatory protein [Enterobacter hormaechei]RTY47510.1 negative regulator GrlR [Enterobacter hormaechei subsp. steigerwaltii]HAV1644956.1 negative regulator GrlR [Enterobacter hormaechei subsp. steigerwaltii]HCR0045735.1 negative regulator GrlR [Enterobacter hormaechei]HCR0053969.1 negative regulator GrlR [Enterobacter hormaechei]
MRDGIYFVVFRSGQNDVGNGTVVVRDNKVNGGDFGFSYQGVVQDGRLNLQVSRHNQAAQSVIAGLNDYVMELSVRDIRDGYYLEGSIAGVPGASLEVQAKFIGNLI